MVAFRQNPNRKREFKELVERLLGELREFDESLPHRGTIGTLVSLIELAQRLQNDCKRNGLGLRLFNLAAELELRAQRKAGTWLYHHGEENVQ